MKFLLIFILTSTFCFGSTLFFKNGKDLKADIIEMEIDTKNSKISMFENDKKVNIKSKK